MNQYLGKYRGKVENNIDPNQKGRIQVSVQAVMGDGTLSWAMPCVPYAGPGVGFFAIPPNGASVWIEFESGDPDRPIWTGCFWDEGDTAPASPAVQYKKVWKTDTCTLTLDDTPGVGGITLETGTGIKITMTNTGIEINDGTGGTIKLTGPKVSINDSALEVT